MKASIHASPFSGGLKNEMFNPDSSINRDGLFNCIILLKKSLLAQGIELNTHDVSSGEIEIYLEGRPVNQSNLPKYLIALESPLINQMNGDQHYLSQFDHVFTWQDGGIMFPSNIKPEPETEKDIFSCMIAGNKSVGGNLYAERLKVIEWYGNSDLFHLYGRGWNLNSWKGEVPYKKDILSRSVFSWCFENDTMNNWITEKIFDCFTSGCIPIYWGASNILDYIPKGCFIDRRDFSSTEEVHEFLLSLTRQQRMEYLNNINAFLENSAYRFSNENFATIITNRIIKDVDSRLSQKAA